MEDSRKYHKEFGSHMWFRTVITSSWELGTAAYGLKLTANSDIVFRFSDKRSPQQQKKKKKREKGKCYELSKEKPVRSLVYEMLTGPLSSGCY